MALDRASAERKDPAWVRAQLAASGSRAVLVGRDGIAVDGGRSVARTPLPVPWPQAGEPILLGVGGDGALFALDLDAALGAPAAGELRRDWRLVGLRQVGAELPRAEGGLAAYAVALVNWHRRHGFCANCGAATLVVEGGYVRRCPRCGSEHFPRTDPVVIMLVEHDDRLLLGRRAGWPPGRYSALAGFLSPGESAEEAVVREVREESGIVAREPTFVASQPWPFPSSLMLGFEARASGGEPVARDGELEDVRWFTREEVVAAIADEGGGPLLPPAESIARFLIERWAEPGRRGA
jgi:NAD+ diphosphatase